jgi:hypothetical protein
MDQRKKNRLEIDLAFLPPLETIKSASAVCFNHSLGSFLWRRCYPENKKLDLGDSTAGVDEESVVSEIG